MVWTLVLTLVPCYDGKRYVSILSRNDALGVSVSIYPGQLQNQHEVWPKTAVVLDLPAGWG